MTRCSHTDQIEITQLPEASAGCAECLADGGVWLHLRICLACGHVGCCDDSPNRHASQHFQRTDHPVIKSFEPGEDWAWCFRDEQMVERIPTFPAESPQVHYSAP